MAGKTVKPTIKQKMEQLQDKIDWFYSDDFVLDEALAHYKEVTMLADEVEKDLNNIKNDVKVLTKDWTK
ncbi:MAG: hypothetical protein LBE03_00255 [Candidatus Nomurabacteria bacterium]|jgi:exonuclease VII small subunit|nr:hypothetical protein [Candidatus Nomurabacteria bacterium]